jgi:putative methionine-R-sulfoxide reductase with GAF domain
MAPRARPYDQIAGRLAPAGLRDERMQAVVDALWEALKDKAVSWVGFYLDQPDEPDDRRLVLGPHRDQTACSPIGAHGVCGQALRFRTARIVGDVTQLGSDYIACDARDRSEIAVPLLDRSGRCWGVLDLDSHEFGAFDESDEAGLMKVLRAAGLV